MPYVNKTITTDKEEYTFIKALIDSITADCSYISCDTSELYEQFRNGDTTPEFTLNVREGTYIINFKRQYKNSDSASWYAFSVNDKNGNKIFEASLQYADYGKTYTENTVRTCSYELSFGSNVLNIVLRKHTGEIEAEMCFVTDSSGEIYSCKQLPGTNSRAIDSAFTFPDGTTANLHNRFTYRNDDLRKIEILKNKVFKTADGATISEKTSVLYDCSYVPANEIITADGNSYVSLGNYTLIGG